MVLIKPGFGNILIRFLVLTFAPKTSSLSFLCYLPCQQKRTRLFCDAFHMNRLAGFSLLMPYLCFALPKHYRNQPHLVFRI